MKRILVIFSLSILFFSCNTNMNKKLNMKPYPQAKKVDTVTNYFGTNIADPYRWLENDTAQDVGEWVKAENEVSNDYFQQIPFREKLSKEFTDIWNYESYSAPFKKGKNYFFYKNDGLQNQAVLYIQEGLEGTPKVFIDPNTLSKEGTTAFLEKRKPVFIGS